MTELLRTSPRSGLTRAEAYEWAVLLRASGRSYKQIAAELCVSASYVRDIFNDPTGEKARARKQRCLKRACVSCGAPSWGDRCADCQVAWQQSEEYRASHTFWTSDRIIAAIRAFADEFGEPPAICDWSPTMAESLGSWERADRGRERIEAREWPWFTTVVNRFGSWNTAIREAGFEPRVASGANGNAARNRRSRRKEEAA